MSLLLFLVFGLIVGAVARFIVPGREPVGWIVALIIGVLGSILGGYFGRALGWYREGQSASFLMSLAGAIVLVIVYHAVTRGRAFP